MKEADALRVLDVLQTFYTNLPREEALPRVNDSHTSEPEEKWNKVASYTALGITFAATPVRSYLFYYSFHVILTAVGIYFGISNESPYYLSLSYLIFTVIASVVFGSVIGATFAQAPIEKMSLEEGIQELPGRTTRSEATSFKPLRIGAKVFSYGIMPFTMMVPLGLTFIEGTPGWGWWRTIPLIPACLADGANTACSFNESFGTAITGISRAVSYVHETLSYKIDRLTRLIRRLEDIFQTTQSNVFKDIAHLKKRFADEEGKVGKAAPADEERAEDQNGREGEIKRGSSDLEIGKEEAEETEEKEKEDNDSFDSSYYSNSLENLFDYPEGESKEKEETDDEEKQLYLVVSRK